MGGFPVNCEASAAVVDIYKSLSLLLLLLLATRSQYWTPN
jgi:hypothetical protein